MKSGIMSGFRLSDYTVRQFRDLFKSGRLNLEPSFQRNSVWKLSDRKLLVETILQRWPLPAVFLRKSYDCKTRLYPFEVVDGKQRLESILLFMGDLKGEHSSFEAKFSLLEDGEPRNFRSTWNNLPEPLKRVFLGYKIPVIEIEGTLEQIHEVFVRINSTGRALKGQEKRNAKYFRSPFLKRMRELAKTEQARLSRMDVSTKNSIARMKDVELLSELVLSVMTNCSVLDKKRALDDVMENRNINLKKLERAIREVRYAIGFVEKLIPNFRTTRFKKSSDFYSLVFLFAKYRHDGKALDDPIAIADARDYLLRLGKQVDEVYDRCIRNLERKTNEDELALRYIYTVREGGDTRDHRKARDGILDAILGNLFTQKDPRRSFSNEQKRLIWGAAKSHECSNPKCRKRLTWDTFTIDHKTPYSKGGRTSIMNARILCRSCNSRKGAH
jgi:5-methylcytosine-specific restriction endonuclease McrA